MTRHTYGSLQEDITQVYGDPERVDGMLVWHDVTGRWRLQMEPGADKARVVPVDLDSAIEIEREPDIDELSTAILFWPAGSER